MSSDYFWSVYKLFYSPPGTPQDLRCINCRYAISGASFTLAAASMYGAKRTGKNNVYVGGIFAMGAIVFLSTGAIAMRLAVDDNKWNENRIKEMTMEMKKQRRENSGSNATQNA